MKNYAYLILLSLSLMSMLQANDIPTITLQPNETLTELWLSPKIGFDQKVNYGYHTARKH